jgi:hypothetical protein
MGTVTPKGLKDKSPKVMEAVSRFFKKELSKDNAEAIVIPAGRIHHGKSEPAEGVQARGSVGRIMLDKVGVTVDARVGVEVFEIVVGTA